MKTANRITSCLIVALLAYLVMGSDGCTEEEPQDKADRLAVSSQQELYRKAQPVRVYEFSNELDFYQQIYDARVEGSVATHTVIRSNTGMILADFPSLGYPIPYDVQLTNPLKVVDLGGTAGGVAIEQPEPNGLYSSKNTAATWVLEIRNIGGRVIVTPFYTEDKVSCYSYPVIVNYETNRVIPVPDVVPGLEITIGKDKKGG